MTDFDSVGLASLQELRESVRTGRTSLDAKRQLALIDLVLRAKEAVRLARADAAKAQAQDLFGPASLTPQPGYGHKMPGDAHG